MKKLLSVFICAVLSVSSAIQTFAYTNFEEKVYAYSAHYCDYIEIKTTDYYNINGIAYIPVSTLTNVANSTEYWGLYAKFNSYDKTLDFRSGADGTSLYNFKRLFTVNRCEAYSSDPYMNDVDYKEKISYDYPPKIIDDHFCIPARTLANPWSIEYDANTKELTIIVQTA